MEITRERLPKQGGGDKKRAKIQSKKESIILIY